MCSACSEKQAVEDPVELESDNLVIHSKTPYILGISVGDTIDEIQKIATSINLREQVAEGLEYQVANLILAHGVEATATLDELGRVYSIATGSAIISDEYGLGVTSTLEDLKVHYPLSQFVVTSEFEGIPNAFFVTPGYLIFDFDPDQFPEGCYNWPRNCYYNDKDVIVSELRVVNIDMTEHVKSLQDDK